MKLSMNLFKRKNGIYYVWIKRNQAKSLRTRNKAEAQQLFNALKKSELKKRIAFLDNEKRTTLKEFKKVFFLRHTDIEDDTIRAYDLGFKLLSDSIGENTLLSRINESKIDKFKKDCIIRGCKKVSINSYLRSVRVILNKAFRWKLLDKKVEFEFFKIGERLPKIIEAEDRKAILSYAKKNDYEMYRVILFALWTGCRRAEIARLQWQDVQGDTCRIIGKGDKERVIPLLPKAQEAMGAKKDIGHVFIHWVDLNKYSKKFKVIARACNIKKRHLHNLRHTAGTAMLESGIPIEIVQEMLGHSDLSTTRIYARIRQEKLKKEMKKLSYDLS